MSVGAAVIIVAILLAITIALTSLAFAGNEG